MLQHMKFYGWGSHPISNNETKKQRPLDVDVNGQIGNVTHRKRVTHSEVAQSDRATGRCPVSSVV